MLRHRHGGRRAVVLAPGHRRGKRQLHHAPQLDRHDPLQLLQRHVCRPGVRPSGVDAGKRWLRIASSPGRGGLSARSVCGARRESGNRLSLDATVSPFSPKHAAGPSGHSFLLISFRHLRFPPLSRFAAASSSVSSMLRLAPSLPCSASYRGLGLTGNAALLPVIVMFCRCFSKQNNRKPVLLARNENFKVICVLTHAPLY